MRVSSSLLHFGHIRFFLSVVLSILFVGDIIIQIDRYEEYNLLT